MPHPASGSSPTCFSRYCVIDRSSQQQPRQARVRRCFFSWRPFLRAASTSRTTRGPRPPSALSPAPCSARLGSPPSTLASRGDGCRRTTSQRLVVRGSSSASGTRTGGGRRRCCWCWACGLPTTTTSRRPPRSSIQASAHSSTA